MGRPRRYLGERLEHESPDVHPGVWNDQPPLFDPSAPEEQHIYIDPPWAVAEWGALPHSRLDTLQALEQVPRAQARPQLQDPV
jgi:hypothetical protein